MFCLQPEELYPPSELLQHPPLATFTNNVLTAFNGLRHCVPLSLVSAATDSVQSALQAIIQTTCTFHRQAIEPSFSRTLSKSTRLEICLQAIYFRLPLVNGNCFGFALLCSAIWKKALQLYLLCQFLRFPLRHKRLPELNYLVQFLSVYCVVDVHGN